MKRLIKSSSLCVFMTTLMLFYTGCNPEVPVLGLDFAGKLRTIRISKKSYVKAVSFNVDQLQSKMLPILGKQQESSRVKLKNIGVGLQVRLNTQVQSVTIGGSTGLWLLFRKD